MTARSCPTCHGLGPSPRTILDGDGMSTCADGWHADVSRALADAQAGLTRAEHSRAARMTATAPPTDQEVWAALGNATVQVWFCPVRAHRTVEWRGNVAHCTHGTCELTSEDTRPWIRDMAEAIAKAEAERDAAREELRQERLRHQLAEREVADVKAAHHAALIEVADLRAEVERLRDALPDRIDPAHVRPMLRLLGPARMVLDKAAVLLGEHGDGAEAAEMAQRITDWIGHPVTDEPAWATLPCEHPADVTTAEREPSDPLKTFACRTCRPCMARMVAGYAPGLVDGAPILDGTL